MESQTKADVTEMPDQNAVGNRSTIEFPYTDLDNAVETVRGVHAAGGNACDFDQLAAQLDVEAKGGGFRLRVNGAKAYGLITYERGGRITKTELGRRIIDASQERAARADAFLMVPLFAKVFETFKGSPLPPQAGFERSLINLGVGSKVADRARQVLLRSAKQAGFFELKNDRLTLPPIKAGEGAPPPDQDREKDRHSNRGGNSGGSGSGTGHPLIDGLIQTLPVPNTPWSTKERHNWLVMANSIFKMIYQTQDDGEVEVVHKPEPGAAN